MFWTSSSAGIHIYYFLDSDKKIACIEEVLCGDIKASLLVSQISQILPWLSLNFLFWGWKQIWCSFELWKMCVCMFQDQICPIFFVLLLSIITLDFPIWCLVWNNCSLAGCMLGSAETMKASGKEQTNCALVLFHGVALVLILKIFYRVLLWMV